MRRGRYDEQFIQGHLHAFFRSRRNSVAYYYGTEQGLSGAARAGSFPFAKPLWAKPMNAFDKDPFVLYGRSRASTPCVPPNALRYADSTFQAVSATSQSITAFVFIVGRDRFLATPE
jgi:hypothetical protein